MTPCLFSRFRIDETVACARHLDTPLVDLDLLMPHINELLAVEVERAEAQKSVISGLTLNLRAEDGEVATDLIRPAAPTLATALLSRLIALRLSARQFSSGVEDIEIRAARTTPSRAQVELFDVTGPRPAGRRPCHRRHPREIRQRLGDLRTAQRLLAPRAGLQMGADHDPVLAKTSYLAASVLGLHVAGIAVQSRSRGQPRGGPPHSPHGQAG